jgi:hypothetical protein
MYGIHHYGYRRNPPFTMQDFLAFLTERGMERLAYLVGEHPDVVEPFLPKLEARLRAKGLLPESAAEEEAATGELSDRDAWNMLADLVPSALSDQPQALRDALVAAFREESARAA